MAQGYRKRGSLYVAALLLTATLGATPAQAGPVFEPAVQLEGYGAGQNVTVYYNGADHTVFAGQYQAHYSGPGPWPAAGQFWTFTTDVGNWAAPGASYGVGVNSTDGLNQGGSIGWLFNHLGGDQLHSNVLAAGIQLALWDLAIDGGDGLWNGDFRYTGADVIALQAAILLDEAKHQHEKGIWLKSNGDGPSVLYRKDDCCCHETPEPGSFFMWGVGLAALVGGGYRWRRPAGE